jgi:integrase
MAGKAIDDLVFTGPKGAVLRVNTFRRRQFAPAVARCKTADPRFPAITPHDLLRTAACLAISVGANVKSVQTMLGRKSAAMMPDVCADLFPDDLDAVAIALDHAVSARSVPKMCPRDAEGPVP